MASAAADAAAKTDLQACRRPANHPRWAMLLSLHGRAEQLQCRAGVRRIVRCLHARTQDSVRSWLAILFVRAVSERSLLPEVSSPAGTSLRRVRAQAIAMIITKIYKRDVPRDCPKTDTLEVTPLPAPYCLAPHLSQVNPVWHFAASTASNGAMRDGLIAPQTARPNPCPPPREGRKAGRLVDSYFLSTR